MGEPRPPPEHVDHQGDGDEVEEVEDTAVQDPVEEPAARPDAVQRRQVPHDGEDPDGGQEVYARPLDRAGQAQAHAGRQEPGPHKRQGRPGTDVRAVQSARQASAEPLAVVHQAVNGQEREEADEDVEQADARLRDPGAVDGQEESR